MHSRVRVRVHLVLESLDGERIAEVKTDQVFRDVFGELSVPNALTVLGRCLETQVISPARGLIRAYIGKLEEKAFHRRRDRGSDAPLQLPEDEAVLAEMDERASRLMREG